LHGRAHIFSQTHPAYSQPPGWAIRSFHGGIHHPAKLSTRAHSRRQSAIGTFLINSATILIVAAERVEVVIGPKARLASWLQAGGIAARESFVDVETATLGRGFSLSRTPFRSLHRP
jgi:hypothetical protein